MSDCDLDECSVFLDKGSALSGVIAVLCAIQNVPYLMHRPYISRTNQLTRQIMAKILFTAFLADMRGKVNGTVFSKNRGGAYARTKVTPTNPQTSFQQAVRSVLSGFSQAWRSLTQAQRDAWNQAVQSFPRTNVFGNAKILSGHQLYIGLNSQLSAAGAASIDNPPVAAGAPALETLTLDFDIGIGGVDLGFGPSPVPANTAMIVEATEPVSSGRSNVNNRFRQIAVVAAAATSPEDLEAAYVAKFGTPAVGQKVFVRAKFVNTETGEVSQSLQASAVVVTT